MLSLPIFAFMPSSVYQGFVGLNSSNGYGSTSKRAYMVLALNLITQLICVSGVNKLSSVRLIFLNVQIESPTPASFVPPYYITIPSHGSVTLAVRSASSMRSYRLSKLGSRESKQDSPTPTMRVTRQRPLLILNLKKKNTPPWP
jgi:hypothetical protein